MAQPVLHIVGTLHGDIQDVKDAPKNYSISTRRGTLEINPEYKDGLDGIVEGATIVVLCWLHRADRSVLKVHPRGDKTRPICGVFNTRSPARPNPIAVSEFKVLKIEGTSIEVSGVDLFDGTPVVDIKKKIGDD